jgi:hypothetical protein
MMCQYLKTEQFMGAVASKYVSDGKENISLEELARMEKKADKEIRTKHDAILCVSTNDVYSTAANYTDLFSIKDDKLKFTGKQETYETYFLSGLPSKVRKTLIAAVIS